MNYKQLQDDAANYVTEYFKQHADPRLVYHNFRPSAFTKNQITNEWYILCSINKLLVITDLSFKVKAVYPLNGNIFNQPEGIAFDLAIIRFTITWSSA